MAEIFRIKTENGKAEIIKFGKGEKPLVILPGLSYDGFLDKAEDLERAYRVFTEKFTVYLIDRNLTPKKGYTVKDMADDVAQVLKRLRIATADVFGVSLGGMVAQLLAVNYPKTVNKLVLGSTLSRPNDTFLTTLARWETLVKKGDSAAFMTDMNKTIYSSYTLKKYADVFAVLKTDFDEFKSARFLTYTAAAEKFDVYGSLNIIKSETLVIGALKDKITTAASARETAARLNCEYFEYRKYGHAVFDEAPKYKERVFKFLTK